jgi:hypothetical protein
MLWASGGTAEDLPTAAIHPVALPDGRLAMSAFMLGGERQSDEKWRDALRQMKAMGVQAVEIGQIAWHEIEKKQGRYDWKYADRVLRINQEQGLGLEIIVDFMFINPGLNNVPQLPAYLKGRSFDDPEVIDGLSRLYEAYFQLPGAGSTRWLFQHFENAAGVMDSRPDDVPRLQRLLRESFARAKRVRPDIRTGVCVQKYGAYGKDPRWPASEIKRWNIDIGADVVPIISFRPDEFAPSDLYRAREEFERVLAAAGGLPVALHECGHHSSGKVGSSDEKQTVFVRELFALLRNYHGRIELMTWYEYSDLNPAAAFLVGLIIGRGNPVVQNYLTGFLGSCGLLTSKGRPKPAAFTWCEEAAAYYRYRSNNKISGM